MAETQKKAAPDAVKFKKGDVTIEGANFNDAWARKLKDKDGVSAEDQFVNEFKDVHFQELTEGARIALLKRAFQGCLAAE
jgi:hypothetical protein